MKSKAAILESFNTPLTIADIEIPELDFGQVLVEIHYSGICGAQLGEISGAKGEDKYLPHLLGHEGSGIVLDVGKGVTYVKQGDHVVMHWRKGVGIEAPFPKYKQENRIVGGGSVTTFAEHAIISENRLTPISKDIPLNIAALMGCSVTTAFGLINNEAQLKIGQSIVVIGCGSVGLSIIQGAAAVSANPIIAIDISEEKLFAAREFGAYTINVNVSNNVLDIVKTILERNGADVVVDCTGLVHMIDKGYCMVAPQGKMILVGQPEHTEELRLKSMRKHYCGKTMLDSQGGLTNPTIDIPRYLDLYLAGRIAYENLISHYSPFKDINSAIDQIKKGIGTKHMLIMRGKK